MHARHLIAFDYNELPRSCCPIILGYDADGQESVFVYQTGGRTRSKNEKLPSWKCLKIQEMKNLTVKSGRWLEGLSHKATQTCIVKVDIDVNIAETLKHNAPLPADSPKLQPPRDKKTT